MTRLFTLILLSCSLLACGDSTQNDKSTNKILGVDLSSLDKSIDPCTDFYSYVNGSWINNNPIPSTESRWSNFNVLRDRNDSLLIGILENAAKGDGNAQIGAYYTAAMDTLKIEEKGIESLKEELNRIKNLKSIDDLPELIAHHHKIGLYSFFSTGVDQDIKNNTAYAVYLSTGSLGLPDRDYYLLDNLAEKKEKYEEHVHAMFKLMGYSDAESHIKAAEVVKIETMLSEKSLTRVERRDPEKTYNKKSLEELQALCQAIHWNSYYNALGLSLKQIIVSQPEYIKALNHVITSEPLEGIKTFLEWNLIDATASKLSSDFANESFAFHAKYLRGVKEMKPRWKRVLSAANNDLGELLGKEYVKIAFSEENKKKVDQMVDDLIVVLEKRIKQLDWMSDQTKEQALKKLSTITRKMGYPEEWKDFSSLALSKESYVGNWFKCNQRAFKEEMAKFGQPINKKEWFMPPQTVNAYYNPVMNEIVFPAGILQPPFFGIDNDDAINYGSMGAVIGHELTHGFDDTGNQFDADGNLKNWWTEEDKDNFKKKAQQLINQYNAYEVLDSTFINGELTQGENIADLGGLSIAYEAYMQSLSEEEKSKKIDDFTPSQRFFISFGQVWRNNQTNEYLKQQVLTDPHSPAEYRVKGVIQNMPEFQQAFSNCSGEAHQNDFIKIW